MSLWERWFGSKTDWCDECDDCKALVMVKNMPAHQTWHDTVVKRDVNMAECVSQIDDYFGIPHVSYKFTKTTKKTTKAAKKPRPRKQSTSR